MTYPRIFSTDSAKAAKATGYGYLNAIHYMAPHETGGHGNLCSHASPECIALCLGKYSGQAAMVADLENGSNSVRKSRANKARLFMSERQSYLNQVALSIIALERKARDEGLTPCIRLNGSTDIAFEKISFPVGGKLAKKYRDQYGKDAPKKTTLLKLFDHIQFVDYTKNPNRLDTAPNNLSLTLSYSGRNTAECVKALRGGHNVAVVFRHGLPVSRQWAGFRVIDGDKHDLRHLDPKGGYVVGLTPKGAKAKKDMSAFTVTDAIEPAWLAA